MDVQMHYTPISSVLILNRLYIYAYIFSYPNINLLYKKCLGLSINDQHSNFIKCSKTYISAHSLLRSDSGSAVLPPKDYELFTK